MKCLNYFLPLSSTKIFNRLQSQSGVKIWQGGTVGSICTSQLQDLRFVPMHVLPMWVSSNLPKKCRDNYKWPLIIAMASVIFHFKTTFGEIHYLILRSLLLQYNSCTFECFMQVCSLKSY